MGPGRTRAVGRDAGPPSRAYRVRIAGERYSPPVAVEKAMPDHRDRIRKLTADGDMDGLGRLMRADPAAHAQYSVMRRAGELAEAAAEGKMRRAMAEAGSRGQAVIAKRMTPADVSGHELAATRRWIAILIARKNHQVLESVLRTPAGKAAWAAIMADGEGEVA